MLNPWLVASSAIALTTKLAIEFVQDEYKVPLTYANVSLPIASVSVLYLLYKLDKLVSYSLISKAKFSVLVAS